MDHMYGKMGINIKGNFEKVSNMVKVMIIIRMEIFIQDNLNMENLMGKDFIYGKMDNDFMDNICKEIKMDLLFG